MDGQLNRIVTQMYFASDPLMGQDRTLAHELNQKLNGPMPPVIFGPALGKRADCEEKLGFDMILIDG